MIPAVVLGLIRLGSGGFRAGFRAGRNLTRDDDATRVVLRANVDNTAALKALSKLQRDLRFQTAVALTRTAKSSQVAATREIGRVFDRPTPFTQRAIGIQSATPARLESSVFVKEAQARYLAPQLAGGHRSLKPFERRLSDEAAAHDTYWVPARGVKLNTYGNLTRAQLVRIASRLREKRKTSDIFIGVPRGSGLVAGASLPYGIWERRKGRLRPLLVAVRQPSYTKRFDFARVALREAYRAWPREFKRAGALTRRRR